MKSQACRAFILRITTLGVIDERITKKCVTITSARYYVLGLSSRGRASGERKLDIGSSRLTSLGLDICTGNRQDLDLIPKSLNQTPFTGWFGPRIIKSAEWRIFNTQVDNGDHRKPFANSPLKETCKFIEKHTPRNPILSHQLTSSKTPTIQNTLNKSKPQWHWETQKQIQTRYIKQPRIRICKNYSTRQGTEATLTPKNIYSTLRSSLRAQWRQNKNTIPPSPTPSLKLVPKIKYNIKVPIYKGTTLHENSRTCRSINKLGTN